MAASPPPLNPIYYVLHDGLVKGPYELAFIEALVMASQLPPSVTLSKDGKVGWERLDVLTLPPLPANRSSVLPPGILLKDPEPGRSSPPPVHKNSGGVNKGLVAAAVFLGVIFLLSWLAEKSQTNSQPSADQPTPQASSAPYTPPPQAQPVYQPPVTTSSPDQTASAVPDQSAAQQVAPSPASSADTIITQASTPQATSDTAATQPAPIVPPPVQTYSMTGKDGQVYMVPDSEYRILKPQKDQLDAYSAQIDRYQTYVTNLGNRVEADRASLDNTDATAVDTFNGEVGTYNSSNDKLKAAIDQYNQQVGSFNAELDRVGTPKN